MRKRAYLVIAIWTVLAGPSLAQDAPKPGECRGRDMLAELKEHDAATYEQLSTASRALENTEAVLWKIEKPGIAPSYLFGTVHLSDTRVATLSPAVRKALEQSRTVALEVANLSEGAMSAAMTNAAQLVMFTDGRRLDQLLSTEEYSKVQAVLRKSGMPGEFTGMFRPWIVSMLLSVSECERRQVASGAAVLDQIVETEAGKLGIPVVGLETIEQQLNALSSISDSQQIDMLRVGLKFADRTDDMIETIVQLYLTRRMGLAMPFQIAMAAKAGASANAFDDFQRLLLVERNRGMRDHAIPLIEKGNAFIAIGALHLPGETGLVTLLREFGYLVSPVE